ncbi:MAG TPA: hypothetical protein VHG93_26085 [Longimicrobium sp.]|nr:hypothetical protein [Longimicrobium sp.]
MTESDEQEYRDIAGRGELPSDNTVDLANRLGSAYGRYAQALQEAWDPEEARRRSESAYLTYLKTLFDSPTDPVRQLEAHLNYAREVEEAQLPPETRERVAAALRQYVDDVLNTVGRMDTSQLDGHALCTAAAHLHAAGQATLASTPFLPR